MTMELFAALVCVAAVIGAATCGLCVHLLWLAVSSPRELLAAVAGAWKAVIA